MSPVAPLTTSELLRLRQALTANATGSPAANDADRIERVRLFEEIKAAAAAAQAVEAVAFDSSQRAGQAAAGVPSSRQGRGWPRSWRWPAGCRRISRSAGWVTPGSCPPSCRAPSPPWPPARTSERRALLVARETVFLSKEDRLEVDAALAPHLEGWGDRRVEAEARKAAYRADPAGLVGGAAGPRPTGTSARARPRRP